MCSTRSSASWATAGNVCSNCRAMLVQQGDAGAALAIIGDECQLRTLRRAKKGIAPLAASQAARRLNGSMR